jgi:S-formylglutathione hydrolase FrmB
MDDISLINGAVPVVVLVLGGLALLLLLLLLVRRRRTAVGTAVAAVVAAVVVLLGLNWFLTRVLGLFPEPMPATVTAWIAVGVGAVVLVVGSLMGTSAGRKVLAIACGLVVLVATGSQINRYFAYYPTVRALTGSEADVSALTGAAKRPSQSVATPVVERWTGPATGKSQVVTAPIPGTLSGFTARDAYIYLPPAYTSPSPPLLPVLILVSGQPGGPQDWVTAGNLQAQLDQFAAANDGLAPVAVVVDPNGPQDTITMCMDSNIAKADTYLSQDVPNWIISELGVDANHAHWAFGGFSYGGTCSIEMATRHPDLFPSFIDISGEREPAISTDRTQTIQTAFGGNTAEFDAQTPLVLLSQRQYPDVWGFFSVGENDTEFVKEMTEVSAAAQKAGMTIKIDPVPDQGHSWAVPAAALLPGLDWLAPRLGLARPATG